MALLESGPALFKPKINRLSPNNMRLILIILFLFTNPLQASSFFSRLLKENDSFLNTSISKEAESRVGGSFRRGSSSMCAAFVADVVEDAGGDTPSNPNLARNWLDWGKPVSLSSIKKGDVIVCWRGSRSGNSGHTLIYVGDGMCVHRSSRNSPIKKIQLKYYEGKILGVRRSN